MNRNSLLIGLAAVVAIGGGVFLAQRLRNRSLPTGNMTQASPTPETGTIASPIPGQPQVKVNTVQGEAIVELHPQIDNLAVAELLAKFSRGECDNLTVTQCGLADKNYVRVISGTLTASAKILSTILLGK